MNSLIAYHPIYVIKLHCVCTEAGPNRKKEKKTKKKKKRIGILPIFASATTYVSFPIKAKENSELKFMENLPLDCHFHLHPAHHCIELSDASQMPARSYT